MQLALQTHRVDCQGECAHCRVATLGYCGVGVESHRVVRHSEPCVLGTALRICHSWLGVGHASGLPQLRSAICSPIQGVMWLLLHV